MLPGRMTHQGKELFKKLGMAAAAAALPGISLDTASGRANSRTAALTLLSMLFENYSLDQSEVQHVQSWHILGLDEQQTRESFVEKTAPVLSTLYRLASKMATAPAPVQN